jgi:DMSO/TMAO reductase YedYZ heme-binding membrane subunit
MRMTYGASIFLIAAGAIIRYALHLKIAGVDEHTIGLILIIAGVIGLIVATIQQVTWTSAMRRRNDPDYDARTRY